MWTAADGEVARLAAAIFLICRRQKIMYEGIFWEN
jgi:hypothetical protein